jgi:L-fucose mutarotase
MLRGALIHPEILSSLASAGHGSLVLVTDGNYPTSTTRGPNAAVVYLNLTPGLVDVPTIVRAIAGAIPVEEAVVMGSNEPGWETPSIWHDLEIALSEAGSALPLRKMERAEFYALASSPAVCLVVVSGDTRLFGNMFLRIGVLQPG